jgi:hypothetical protein
MNFLQILDLIHNETYITETKKIGDLLGISTLFTYSDGGNIDVFIKITQDPENVTLSDGCNIALEFLFSSNQASFMENILKSEPIQNLIERYKITISGLKFEKQVSINRLSEEIFKFGEFCSIISNILLASGIVEI